MIKYCETIMKEAESLKCPFCGSEHQCVVDADDDDVLTVFHVKCLICNCKGPSGTTQAKAVERWNVRCRSRK